MAQLVQLHKNKELFEEHNAQVLVIFREESEGQAGLKKVVDQTEVEFTLALDTNAVQTSRYSPGEMVHDSYVLDADGVIRAILAGKRYDRAQIDQFAQALRALRD